MRLSALVLLLLLAGCAEAPPSASSPESGAPAGSIDAARVIALLVPAGAAAPSGEPVTEPVAPGLELICYIAAPPEGHPLSQRDLAGLGLGREAAIALARANVAAGLRPMGEVIRPLQPGEVGTIAGDFAEASRLLLHEEWAPVAQEMGGNLLVSAPTADTVLYTRGGVPGALSTIASMAEAAATGAPRPVSASVLRWTAGGWEVVAKAPGRTS